MTMSWQGGRQLAALTKGSSTLSFAYNESGLRTSKTVNGAEHRYYWTNGKLSAEMCDAYSLFFHYDANGDILGYTYKNGSNTTEYYYVKNLQGDVCKVVNANGGKAAEYVYDAWGRVLSATGTMANINPIRYRGYYYDTETGLYYLQSRYFDPEVGRFINADAYASTGQGILGCNMFAYCGNNSVNAIDPNGKYYTPGQIHDFVIDDICEGKTNMHISREDNRIKYNAWRFSWYGYCDIYDERTGEVWEIKRFSLSPSCLYSAAEVQLERYLEGSLVKNPRLKLIKGGEITIIEPHVFIKPDNDGRGVYVIGYFDTCLGIVYYDYRYIPSASEIGIAISAVALAALVGYAGPLPVIGAMAFA